MNGQTIRTITIRGTSEGLDKLTGDLQKLAAAEQNVAVVSDDLTKRQISLEQAYKRQSLRLDEAARAQANFARETKLANDALRQGVATPEQHARSLELINQRYGQVTTSAKQMIAGMTAAGDAGAVASQKMIAGMSSGGEAMARGTGLARHELINLSRQAQDVGVSLVSGQSPLMILAQQGSQIADVFISSGKSVGDFFSQATSWAVAFAKTPVGIATGILAIGAAAAYAAYQFTKSSTTIEQALENQNRLLKEGKALIDARTSAAERATLQARDQTEYETLRNLIDLQKKLKEAQKDAGLGAGALGVLSVPGLSEPGAAFSGVAQQMAPGMDKVAAAVERLNAAQAAGLPGLKDFLGELGRIGMAHPEIAKTIDKLLDFGRAGIEIENAAMKAKAMSDALAGVATNAQLAAVGLGSIAQFQLNNMRAEQMKEATERTAKATLELAALYPGMSVEIAKQAHALDQQIEVARARTEAEATILRYKQQIADAGLQGQKIEEATLMAEKQRALTLAQANSEADRMLKTLQQEGELLRASSEEERERIRARQTYEKLIEQNVDPSKASAIAAQMQANARATRDASDATKDYGGAAQGAADATKSWSVQMDEANDAINSVSGSLNRNAASAQAAAAATARYFAEYEKAKFLPFSTLDMMGGFGGLYQSPQGGYSQFDPGGYTSTRYASHQVPRLTPLETDFSSHFGLDKITDPLTRLALGLGPLTEATKENTEATSAMTDVLSPFYSSDPRKTHLGFRAFAGGGIMTQYGELPLKHYQGGGMATSPQVAMFGEGSTPEAYVPVPSGRIPVEIKAPANNNQRPITVNINVMGNADERTVGALKTTAFQQAQTMRRAMS